MDEFSPEQRLVVEILRYCGTPNPEAVVRGERMEAYRLGAHLMPPLARLAAAWTSALETYVATIGRLDRPNPNAGRPPAAPS